MRWTIMSVVVAIALLFFGFFATGGDNMDIAEKAIFWFCAVGFLMAQGVHLLVWVRKHDL